MHPTRFHGNALPLAALVAMAVACAPAAPTAATPPTVGAPPPPAPSTTVAVPPPTPSAAPAPSASGAPPAAPAAITCPVGMLPIPGTPPFCIDETEVTAADYAACLAAGVCPQRNEMCMETLHGQDRLTHVRTDEGSYPARCMMAPEAAAYCAWRGKRLPTEPEWVLAACGTDGRTYPWGNDKPTTQVCWMGEPGGSRGTTQRGPCKVGSFPAGRSPYGMLDAAGNVEEWTATEVSKFDHAVHGGGYDESWAWMACAKRMSDGAPSTSRGFRCAK